MRLAIVADIHANFRALQAVLTDITRTGAERIISLGDNIGYGPEPEEVVRTLLEHRVVSVMGNHELALISRGYYNRLHATARQSLALTRALLSADSLSWLGGLAPVEICFGTRFVHGCPPQSMTVYLHTPTDNRLQRVFASYPEHICFVGHIHDLGFFQLAGGAITRREVTMAPWVLDARSRYLILAGSVGQPRDILNWHAKYMLWDLEKQTLEARAVPYDVQTTIRLLGERGFPDTNARRLFW
jgi:diadenosine tetraphosphatase ApaH/serine/threonine PP2A family protein phosphatase